MALSGVTDAYQPVERKLGLTRRCLEVFLDFRNPVGIVTKGDLVVRDADLLSSLAAVTRRLRGALDRHARRGARPRDGAAGAVPRARLEAIRALSSAGVPTSVYVAPVVPGLNDHEMPAVLAAAREAGARFASSTPVRLPLAVAPLFLDWLERNVPLRKDKVLSRIRDVRGGRLNDPGFCSRMRGEGPYAEQLRALFRVAARKAGFEPGGPSLSAASFRVPSGPQLSLFP